MSTTETKVKDKKNTTTTQQRNTRSKKEPNENCKAEKYRNQSLKHLCVHGRDGLFGRQYPPDGAPASERSLSKVRLPRGRFSKEDIRMAGRPTRRCCSTSLARDIWIQTVTHRPTTTSTALIGNRK